MKIVEISNLNETKILENIAVMLGNFDGIHLGHKAILDKLLESDLPKGIMVFDPHPNHFFDSSFKELMDLGSKIEYFTNFMDYFIILKTSDEILSSSKYDFINFMKNNHIVEIVCGNDYTFGKNKEGSVKDLVDEFYVSIVPDVQINNKRVSSTSIRKHLINGEILEANKELGRDYSVEGIVVDGNHLGRTINFRTANLNKVSTLVPKKGVYLGYSYIDGDKVYAIVNVGMPSFVNNDGVRVEAHYLDFYKDIYYKKIKVHFVYYMRDMKKLHSIKELEKLLQKDKENAKKILKK